MKKKKKRKHYHHKKPTQPAQRPAVNPLQQQLADINRLTPIMQAAQWARARQREREGADS